MLISTGAVTIDVSLDVMNSPPIIHQSVTCVPAVLFGLLGTDFSLSYYGFGPFYTFLGSSSFGGTSCTRIVKNIHGMVGGYGWVGNKFWIVGGTTNAGSSFFFSFSSKRTKFSISLVIVYCKFM
jgi:hypothetical protein